MSDNIQNSLKNTVWGGNDQPRNRESNIELFRIITMLLIVAHHYVVNSGVTEVDGLIRSDPKSTHSIFLLVFGAWGKIGINCFVMITGYFMCKSHITSRKFVKLVGEYLFYKYMIHAVFFFTGYETLNIRNIVKAIVPITQVEQNFTGCFILFWICIPFLNMLVHNINERQHLRLLGLLCVIYILFGTIHHVSMNYVSWFCVLYLISAYIRLYPKKWMNSTIKCGFLFLTSIILCAVSIICCIWLGVKLNIYNPYYFVSDSNAFLAVVCGLMGFLFFKNIHIPYSRAINTIAASTFGVLLIHAHSDSMRKWLWKDVIDVTGHYSDKLMPLYSVVCVISIFVICVIIDQIRINLIEKPFFKWWDKHWNVWYKRFNKKEINDQEV